MSTDFVLDRRGEQVRVGDLVTSSISGTRCVARIGRIHECPHQGKHSPLCPFTIFGDWVVYSDREADTASPQWDLAQNVVKTSRRDENQEPCLDGIMSADESIRRAAQQGLGASIEALRNGGLENFVPYEKVSIGGPRTICGTCGRLVGDGPGNCWVIPDESNVVLHLHSKIGCLEHALTVKTAGGCLDALYSGKLNSEDEGPLQAEAFLDKLPQDDQAIPETFDAFVSRQTGIVDRIVPNERNST